MAKLTPIQKKKLPVELQIIIERFEHEPELLNKIKSYLGMAAQKIQQHSLNHSTFCDGFPAPYKLVKELLKLFGVTEKELKLAMRKIGFVENNRQYNDIYYQTFSVAYLIGLNFDDKNIRGLSQLMISLRLWNGRKISAFPQHCDPDTARYVMNYMLKGNSTYKKSGSAFAYLDSFHVPAMEIKYKDSIADNLDSDTEGLRKLMESAFGRIIQLFRSIKKHYYNAIREGKKEVTSSNYGQQHGDGDMVESRESFSGNVERLVDKIEKNSMLKKNVLVNDTVLRELKKHYQVTYGGIKLIQDWIEDEENEEEIRYFYELVFGTMKPKSETDICHYDAKTIASKITTSKKDEALLDAKKVLDHALVDILGEDILKKGPGTVYKAKSIIALCLIMHAKVMLCKKV